jgi:hypothetical protein
MATILEGFRILRVRRWAKLGMRQPYAATAQYGYKMTGSDYNEQLLREEEGCYSEGSHGVKGQRLPATPEASIPQKECGDLRDYGTRSRKEILGPRRCRVGRLLVAKGMRGQEWLAQWQSQVRSQ